MNKLTSSAKMPDEGWAGPRNQSKGEKRMNQPVSKIEPPKLRVVNGVPHSTSLGISASFAVAHKNVLRAIESCVNRLKSEPVTATFASDEFIGTSYQDSHGQERKMYLLTEEGFAMSMFLFKTPQAMLAQTLYVKEYKRMRHTLFAKELEKVKWRYADDQLLPFGEEVIRRSMPTSYAAQWLRHRRILPDMTTAKMNAMVRDGKLEGRFIPLKSIVYNDSLASYLHGLGVLSPQSAIELN